MKLIKQTILIMVMATIILMSWIYRDAMTGEIQIGHGGFGGSADFRYDSSGTFGQDALITSGIQYDEMIGVYAESREVLLQYLKREILRNEILACIPLLKIELVAEDTGDNRLMVIKTEEDLPHKSVPTDCPRSQKYHFKKCWFIKYGEDK
jgi:hypothetical protein